MPTDITVEQLEARGFKRTDLGYTRELSPPQAHGPALTILFGTFPRNSWRASIIVGGYCVITSAANMEDINELIRLFSGAHV